MKQDKLAPSLLLIFSLCLTCAPLSSAQRRPSPQRPARQSPQPRRRQTTERPVNTPASQQPSTQQAQRPARRETERSFDSLVAAESYGIYAELRAVGQFMRSDEFRRAVETLQGIAGTGLYEQNIVESLFFFAMQNEALKDARLVVAVMPARESIPDALFALEFPSVEAASGFEPKLRNFLSRQFSALMQRAQSERAREAQARRARADDSATEAEADGAQPSPDKMIEPPVKIRRVANIIFASDRTFTLKAIGGASLPSLADDTRFQSVRNRFAGDPIFIYLDIARMEQADARSREKYERQRAEHEREAQQSTQSTMVTADPGSNALPETTVEPSADVVTAPTTDETTELEPGVAIVSDEGGGAGAGAGEEPVNVGTDEDAALHAQAVEGGGATVRADSGASDFMLAFVFGRLLSGVPRWPEAVGFSVGFDSDDYILRALAHNAQGGRHSIIPLFPAFVSGPVAALEASSVAPAESDIFATASIDWRQVYEMMLKPAPEFVPPPPEVTPGAEVIVEEAQPTQTREQSIEMLEKVLGFKIKEDFLPALGHEIAFSAPFGWLHSTPSYNTRTKPAAANEARPGPVILVSLSNAEAMRKMLPRLLAASAIAASNNVEKRAGVDINTSGGLSYAFINNYLAITQETPALRHFVDTMSQGLGSNQSFRGATAWQPRQKLGQVYISPKMIETFLAEARKWADPSDPELEALLARLNFRPTATSYAVTDEGDGRLFHELRLPKSLLTIFSTQQAVSTRQSARIQNETMAMTYLRTIGTFEEGFKSTAGNGGYASLDELMSRFGHPGRWPHLSKDELDKFAYKIEVTLSGTGFYATATPREYGRTSRRSFFIDESGVLRAADRKGEPATADDPPVD